MEQILNAPQVKQTNTSKINTNVESTNGLGLAGFIMSLIGLVLCWVPILKWFLLLPAFILSLIGHKRNPSKLAAVGAIISGVILTLLILRKVFFWGSIMSLALL